MHVEMTQSRIAGLRWITVRGESRAAFEALGEHVRDDIRSVIHGLPEREGLIAGLNLPAGARAYDTLLTRTRASHPQACVELEALARGAGLEATEMYLANFRGDLAASDGTGCTDLQWTGSAPVVGHNEDGAPAVAGVFTLLTLILDDEPPVFTQWYPGFLPSNSLTLTPHLWWAIDHLPVRGGVGGSGRHFVARDLRHSQTVDEAVDYLKGHPSAGGFAYNMAQLNGRIVQVESAAGHTAVAEVSGRSQLAWHTNHARHLPPVTGWHRDDSGGEAGNGPCHEDTIVERSNGGSDGANEPCREGNLREAAPREGAYDPGLPSPEQPAADQPCPKRSTPDQYSSGQGLSDRHLPLPDQPLPDQPSALLGDDEESRARAAWLTSLDVTAPSARHLLGLLSGDELPDGVLRTARGKDPLMTLCTTVLDPGARELTFRSHRGDVEEVSIDTLLAGVSP